jgi:2-(1,2-epoxy-1,2-dihydrophenyl)acetyl-CoA isomerase
MTNALIDISDNGAVRTLTLDDPASLNSLSEALATQLSAALSAAQQDAQVRCVVLTGRGKAFCAGGNLKDFMREEERLDHYIGRAIRKLYGPLALQLRDFGKPLLTALNGPAIGAGAGLALNADLVLATRSAYFSLPFVPVLGAVPDMGVSWLLPRRLGYARALGYALTGERLTAAEAVAAGLIWQCVEDDRFAAAVDAAAAKLAALPLQAVRRTRQALAQAHGNSLEQQLELEAELQATSFGSAEFREGLAAFKAHRAPDFTGMQ